MANVFIHGRSPTNQQLSLRCDATGVLLSTVDIEGENGEKLIINQLPLPNPPTIAGSINALNFGLDTETNLAHPISVDEFGLLNVNVISGGGAGSGIIKGANIDGGLGIDISADERVEGTETINRLYTHSSLYAQYTDDFGVKTDLPLNTNVDGVLNVSVVGGDGVIKGISTGAGNPEVSLSAEVVTPSAGASINKLYTHSSLYGFDIITEQEKPVDVNTEGYVSVNVKNIPTVNVEVSNNVITSPIVQNQSFDVVLNADLYADSTGNENPPFIRDPRGLQGWYYINTDPLKSSNVYYYSNIPALILTKQSNVLLENINFFYAVITIDYIGSFSSNLPFLVMGSQALGENDHIPNFANTTYAYTLPVGYTYITGEPFVIYWSDSLDKKPLETFMPNLRRVKLNNPIITGTGESNKLAYFSINTSTAVVEKQEYTLIGAGYKFNSTQGEQGGVINDAVFDFLFTAQTPIENNLAKLTFNGNNQLLVSTATITSSGSFGNIALNNTLTTGQETNAYSLNASTKKDCILTVSDSSITSTGYYSISVSSDSGNNYELLGIVQPIVSLNGTRGGSTTLNLSPYQIIKLTNESGGTYENVYVSLYTS
jgi:hypothetical protein